MKFPPLRNNRDYVTMATLEAPWGEHVVFSVSKMPRKFPVDDEKSKNVHFMGNLTFFLAILFRYGFCYDGGFIDFCFLVIRHTLGHIHRVLGHHSYSQVFSVQFSTQSIQIHWIFTTIFPRKLLFFCSPCKPHSQNFHRQ